MVMQVGFNPETRGYFLPNECPDQTKIKLWNWVTEDRYLVLFLTIQKSMLEGTERCSWQVKASAALVEEGKEGNLKRIKIQPFEVHGLMQLGSWDYFSAREEGCVNMDPDLSKEDLVGLFNATLVDFHSYSNGFRIYLPLMLLEEEAEK